MTTGFKPMPPEPSDDIKARYVGKIGIITENGLNFEVAVSKVKNRFGNVDALVSPIAGSGEKWVLASRLHNLTELV